MRIVYVCADRGIEVYGRKGAAIHIQEMVRAFTALGHEVRILCARAGSRDRGKEGLKLEEVTIASGEGGFEREAKERAAMALADAIEDHLTQLYQDWPFDLIYERYSLWSAAGCRGGRRLNVSTIVEFNAPLIEEQATYRQLELAQEARRIENEVCQSATALVSVSRQLSDYLVTRGASPEKIATIGNAVDTKRFSPVVRAARPAGIEKQHFVIGFTGSLKLWHGIDQLMLAFQGFHQQLPHSKLLLVGDGPKRGWAEGFTVGAGLQGAILTTGWIAHQELPALIACMDVAVAPYPASPNHYFSPLKLYEYLAMGRPIVASRIGQAADLLEHGRDALLSEPGNVDDLTTALLRLYYDQSLASRLAAAATQKGRQYDWQHNARRVVELAGRQAYAYA